MVSVAIEISLRKLPNGFRLCRMMWLAGAAPQSQPRTNAVFARSRRRGGERALEVVDRSAVHIDLLRTIVDVVEFDASTAAPASSTRPAVVSVFFTDASLHVVRIYNLISRGLVRCWLTSSCRRLSLVGVCVCAAG